MSKQIELLQKKLSRESEARKQAEQLLEEKSLELYNSNEKLKDLNTNLEFLVEERTEKLKDSELEYQTMVESINDMIFRLDLSGKISFVNQIAYRILGEEGDNFIGRSVFDFISPKDRKKVFSYFARQYLKRNCINYYEIGLETRFNKKIWLRLNVQFSSSNCKFCIPKQHALAGIGDELIAESNCKFKEIIIVAHDITQQRLAQERLEKSEKKYRELTESLPEMICELEVSGKLTYVNKYALDKLGYTKEEVLSESFNILNIFPGKQRKQVEKILGSIAKTGEKTANEYIAVNKKGQELDVIVYTSPILEQGKVIGLRGVMFDISVRKRQELEIAHNLKQQKLLSDISMSYNSLIDFENKTKDALRLIGEHLNVSRVYIFEDNEDGEFTSNTYEWCNNGIDAQINELQDIPYSIMPSWKKFLEEEGIIFSENITELPKDIYDILEPQSIKSVLVFPLKLREKQLGFIGFDQCVENHYWRESEIELLRTISNVISHNFQRQRVQNNLVESEIENRIIIDSIPDVIIHSDSWGEIKALKASKKSNLLNLVKNKNSNSIFSAFNEKVGKLIHDAIKECLEKEEFQVEFKNLNWGEMEYYEARLVKLNESEVLIIVRDVTVIKEHEKQLEIAKNKAEEASKMKSEFLANVSHEIRTPLNAILGFSQWLFDNTEAQMHKEYLSSIINSGRSLLDVINDILDLSRIEVGKIDIELNPMNYREIVSDVKFAFQNEIEQKELSFKITTEDSIPEYLFMDELRFYQILFNLVSNAVKFTERGYIHVLATAVKNEKEDEVDLIISVEDTGIGIPEEKQKVIFDSFTQQDGQSNRKYEGTGLGLAIVDGLLKRLNGTISIQSKVGKGSTFTLTFSGLKIDHTTHVDSQLQLEANVSSAVLGPCTIMIVDDIEYNIGVLKALINSKHVNYIEAIDGSEALAKLNTEKPDLIFMDIRMPGLDGFEVTKLIKNNNELKHVPIIAFSASTLKSRTELIELLFDDFLQKPVFKKDLEDMLLRFLPDKFKYKEVVKSKSAKNEPELSNECIANLPAVLKELENNFLTQWKNLKGSLVIYEIEEFKSKLSDMAYQNSCNPVLQFCSELDMALHAFDIELIEKRMADFPKLIDHLKKVKG